MQPGQLVVDLEGEQPGQDLLRDLRKSRRTDLVDRISALRSVPREYKRVVLQYGASFLKPEVSKLTAETLKFYAETSKLKRERAWHPVLIATAAFTSGAALAKLLIP